MDKRSNNFLDNYNNRYTNVTFPTDSEYVSLLLFGDTQTGDLFFHTDRALQEHTSLKLMEKIVQQSIDNQKILIDDIIKHKKQFEQQQQVIQFLKERIESIKAENEWLRESIAKSLKGHATIPIIDDQRNRNSSTSPLLVNHPKLLTTTGNQKKKQSNEKACIPNS
jgi:hypothetical protein